MGARQPPTPPNPFQTVRQQQGFNREAMTDAARFSNVNQRNPWGARTFSGTPGTDDYKQTTTLNPADQSRLDSTRYIQNALLGSITGQGGGGAGKAGKPQEMPPMQSRMTQQRTGPPQGIMQRMPQQMGQLMPQRTQHLTGPP